MTKYILNSAVITTPGDYSYRLVSVEEAAKWYAEGPTPISTIGYQETADALGAILGISIPVNRAMVKMVSGEEALVFRLTIRLNDPAVKGQINNPAWLLAHSEIGILMKK